MGSCYFSAPSVWVEWKPRRVSVERVSIYEYCTSDQRGLRVGRRLLNAEFVIVITRSDEQLFCEIKVDSFPRLHTVHHVCACASRNLATSQVKCV